MQSEAELTISATFREQTRGEKVEGHAEAGAADDEEGPSRT